MAQVDEYKTEYKTLSRRIEDLDRKLGKSIDLYAVAIGLPPINENSHDPPTPKESHEPSPVKKFYELFTDGKFHEFISVKEFFDIYTKIKDNNIFEKVIEKKDAKAKRGLQLSLMKGVVECLELSIKIFKKKLAEGSNLFGKATKEEDKKDGDLDKKLKPVTEIFNILKIWKESEVISTTTEKALMAVLGDDEKAFEFWKANVGTAVNNTIRAKDFWEKLCAAYPDEDFNCPNNKILNITPYALKVVVDLCDGWDNFVEACKESNPFDSIVCTKSRATLCENTDNDMKPKEGGKFYKDRATVGQAPFGSFFLLAKTRPDAEEEADKWSALDSTGDASGSIAVLVPVSKSLPDSWKMESNGKIMSINTGKYLTWQAGRRNRVTLQNEGSEKLNSWSIKSGIIYCKNPDSKSVYEDAFCLCSDGGNIVKGDGSMGNTVVFTFVNYLPWIEGEDVVEQEDDDDDLEEEDEKKEEGEVEEEEEEEVEEEDEN